MDTDPLQFIEMQHKDHLALCDLLEEIADSLPAQVDRKQCSNAVVALESRVMVHHALEEAVLFPRIKARAKDDPELESRLDAQEDPIPDDGAKHARLD